MPSASLLPAEISGHLARGGTVLTGNQRAARTLRLAFDRERLAGGLSSWQPPPIFAWDTWTANLYGQLLLNGHATRVVLNLTQELQLWRSAIEADTQWASLQAVDSLAALAADAWQILCAYRGRQRLNGLTVSGDTRNFQRWARTFGRRCASGEYLTAAELEEALVPVVASGHLVSSSPEVLLLGFDTKTPAQQALIEAFRDFGIRIGDHLLPPVAGHLHLAPAETLAEELSHAAQWVRGFISDNPRATVAVIVPSLAAERRKIDRVFRHALAPELEDIAATGASPCEFSLGQPLASTPLVSTAIELLRLAAGALPVAAISRLLLSPHFGGSPAELSARAEFDAFELRHTRLLNPEITLKRLTSLVATATRRFPGIAGLLQQLRSFERTTTKFLSGPAPKQRSCSGWSEAMRELLESAGWPGSGPLDSTEFQTRQKFDSALDELATLDFDGTRATFPEALIHLKAILQRTLFAPESRQAPIQIMSPLEAAGSRFDALCFLRASDLEWPLRPATNPLLGWQLQRTLGMPGSDPALDFAHAQRIADRIAASADTVVFSYAKQTEDSHQRPSPLLANMRLEALSPSMPAPAPAPVKLEAFDDDVLIPLAGSEVHGGANVLKLQAACGFRAFAEHRLRSTAMELPEAGMDALERGTIVHAVLEHLWSDLHTQAALRALTAEQRAAQLSRSIEHSLRRAAASLASASSPDLNSDPGAELDADPATEIWPAAYLDLQRQRLHRLLTPWLEKELERPAFEVVLREANETASIGPLSLKLRIDRVDRLLDLRSFDPDIINTAGQPDGTILIDYKTGVAKPSDWAGARPDEPQLPLYAVLREPGSVAAVAFANVRAGRDMGFAGYSGRQGALRNFAKLGFPTLEVQIQEWRRILTTLAEDFAAGDARVDPKSYPETCKHCDQRLLCRLDPALLALDEDADGETTDEASGEDDV